MRKITLAYITPKLLSNIIIFISKYIILKIFILLITIINMEKKK